MMQNLETRRLNRAERKAAEAGLNLTPSEALAVFELADKNGDLYGLSGVGRFDPLACLIKG